MGKENKTDFIQARVDKNLHDEFIQIAEAKCKKKGTLAADVINVFVRGHMVGWMQGERALDIDVNDHETVEVTITLPKSIFDNAVMFAQWKRTNVVDMIKHAFIDYLIGHRHRLLKRGKAQD